MENLDKLLEYQKVDIELRKVLDEIERSDDSKKLEQAKTEFNNAKATVTETEKAAENIISFYNSALSFMEECDKRTNELADKMEKTEDIEAQRELAAQIEKIRDKLSELERKLSERSERADKAIAAYRDGQERGKKMRAVYNNVKERLDKFKKEKEPKIAELMKKLDALKPDIPADVFEVYKALTAERKYPAFVAAIDAGDKKHYRCFCGITLSQKAQSELLDKGQCRCENCRRLIYK